MWAALDSVVRFDSLHSLPTIIQQHNQTIIWCSSMRKYQPIWLELKTKNEVLVVHPNHLHARLIKAVLKERTMDTGFRLELSELNRYAKVFFRSTGNYITFTLKYYLDPTDL